VVAKLGHSSAIFHSIISLSVLATRCFRVHVDAAAKSFIRFEVYEIIALFAYEASKNSVTSIA
jgi:hypothetical protein